MLGFGVVKYYSPTSITQAQGIRRKNSNGFYRLVVSDITNIFSLALIFNGNLVLHHRINQLSSWVNILKDKNLWVATQHGDSQNVSQGLRPTLEDSWLSGFTDAEGCFNVNITARTDTISGFRIRPRFLLDQKDAYDTLSSIRNLFGFGRVTLRGKTNNVYRYSIDSFKSLMLVRDYFISFPLKTKKSKSFEHRLLPVTLALARGRDAQEVYNMCLKKEHLTVDGLKKVREITKNINNDAVALRRGIRHKL